MVYPMVYMDEDNYEDCQQLLSAIGPDEASERVFIGSGCDAPEAWAASSKTVCPVVAAQAAVSASGVQH